MKRRGGEEEEKEKRRWVRGTGEKENGRVERRKEGVGFIIAKSAIE